MVEDKDRSGNKKKRVAEPYMQNRELSWLTFNQRVLDQGADPNVPLIERMQFVSIFWSNLQEFFMVRVGSLTDLQLLKKEILDSKTLMTPSEQLSAIYKRCHELYPLQEAIYHDVRNQLAEHGVKELDIRDLNAEQLDYLRDYLNMNVVPFLSPQIINSRHPFPHLENGALYVVVRLDGEAHDKSTMTKAERKAAKAERKKQHELGAEGVTLGLIPMPRQAKQVITLPGENLQFVRLENAVEMIAPEIFSMYRVKHTNIICVTRNADLDATEGADEHEEDYREFMKKILKKRSRLAPVRLESKKKLSKVTEDFLLKPADRWILSKVNSLTKEMTENMDKFELGIAVQKVHDFIWDEFCDWYVEIAKYRIYHAEEDSQSANCALWVLKTVLGQALKLLHPFMPFITEEIYGALVPEEESLMMSSWPVYREDWKFPYATEVIEHVKAIAEKMDEIAFTGISPEEKMLLRRILFQICENVEKERNR